MRAAATVVLASPGGEFVVVRPGEEFPEWAEVTNPHAIADGHTWLGLGVAGIPVAAYVAPAIIIATGGAVLLRLSRDAVARDDAAEATSSGV